MITEKIINSLLDLYEKSKHLFEIGSSNRRVMLKTNQLKGYEYENAGIRDDWNKAAQELEYEELISIEWYKNRPVICAVILNLDNVYKCYEKVQRVHPKEKAEEIIAISEELLSDISIQWILDWEKDVILNAENRLKIPQFCKDDSHLFRNIAIAFRYYDSLNGKAITMRTFSSKCFHDTKYFERNIRDIFLRVAKSYNKDFADLCDQDDIGRKDQLAFLGIYERPELYELSGDIKVIFNDGVLDIKSTYPYGVAIPSTAVDSIESFNLGHIKKIIFIENKTNYDEYLVNGITFESLIIYHGGFMSPKKKQLFSKLKQSLNENIDVYFWADIDLGGFKMFSKLKEIFPFLQPLNMSAQDVEKYHKTGLSRDEEYLKNLRDSLNNNDYPLFNDAIKKILDYKVTIEQEAFLEG